MPRTKPKPATAKLNILKGLGLEIAAQTGEIGPFKAQERNITFDVNQVNKEGCSYLFAASRNNHVKLVIYLIANGANVDKGNKFGETPLWIAASNNVSIHILQSCFINSLSSRGPMNTSGPF